MMDIKDHKRLYELWGDRIGGSHEDLALSFFQYLVKTDQVDKFCDWFDEEYPEGPEEESGLSPLLPYVH